MATLGPSDNPGGHAGCESSGFMNPAQPAGTTVLRIFVVDDQADVADALAALLETMGTKVASFCTARQALCQAQWGLPHVALLDLNMPDMDGFELARQIRSLPGGGQVRVVAVTGWAAGTSEAAIAAAGFDGFLLKPATPEQLQMLMESVRKSTRVGSSGSRG